MHTTATSRRLAATVTILAAATLTISAPLTVDARVKGPPSIAKIKDAPQVDARVKGSPTIDAAAKGHGQPLPTCQPGMYYMCPLGVAGV
ncbi:hypothetical protein ACPPVQ_05890 [Diaminobutyricibacter sp. McL0618]|uniref:hypothetical protein n=1 Tax=Leifsonia sp. McL0618 TaxID=3415677 RepID=UPI003CFB072B